MKKMFKFLLLPAALLLMLRMNLLSETEKKLVVFQFDTPKVEGTPKEVLTHTPTLKDKQDWCKKDKDCATLAEAAY